MPNASAACLPPKHLRKALVVTTVILMTNTTAETVTLSCDCSVCIDLPDVTADARILDGVTRPDQISHTYVQYAAGTSPLARIMCSRYDVKAV